MNPANLFKDATRTAQSAGGAIEVRGLVESSEPPARPRSPSHPVPNETSQGTQPEIARDAPRFSLALLAALAVSRLLLAWEHEVERTIWTLPGLLSQDLVVVGGFACLETTLRRSGLSRALFGLLLACTLLSYPVMRLFGSPMTVQMFRAAGGALADSIRSQISAANLLGMAVILAAGLLPLRARYPNNLPRTFWLMLMILSLAASPLLARKIDLQGLERNPIWTLIASCAAKVEPSHAQTDWRKIPGLELSAGRPSALGDLAGKGTGFNLMIISLESTGARHLPFYAAAPDATPHLTALAREAVIFENAYAVYPESVKGLFSVLCSLYLPMDLKLEDYAARDYPSFPRTFAQAGYRTALFHSGRFMYLGMEAVVQNRGFQSLCDAGQIGGNVESSFGVDEPAAVHSILQWIDSLAPGDRFLCHYLPIAGHHPYETPAPGPFPELTEEQRHLNALHFGDAAIGALVEGLQARGLYEKTVFLVYGDHGEAFGEHPGNYGHTFHLFEENVRVPLLLAAPGILGKQRRTDAQSSLLDIAPTLLDFFGLPPEPSMQGVSLLREAPGLLLFATDYSYGLLGLRCGPWKHIYEIETGRRRLFNLEDDPREKTNLAANFPSLSSVFTTHSMGWASAQKGLFLR